MSRFQGIGGAYYGKSDYNPKDFSYITTEWFVLFLLPIYPKKCFRVIKLGKKEKNINMVYSMGYSASVSYKILEQISKSNNKNQIIKTYLTTYGLLAVFIGSLFLVQINDLFVWIPMAFFAGLLIYTLMNGE